MTAKLTPFRRVHDVVMTTAIYALACLLFMPSLKEVMIYVVVVFCLLAFFKNTVDNYWFFFCFFGPCFLLILFLDNPPLILRMVYYTLISGSICAATLAFREFILFIDKKIH